MLKWNIFHFHNKKYIVIYFISTNEKLLFISWESVEFALGLKHCYTNAILRFFGPKSQEINFLHQISTFGPKVHFSKILIFLLQSDDFTPKSHFRWKWHPKLFINASVHKHFREGAGKVTISMEFQLLTPKSHFILKTQPLEQNVLFCKKRAFGGKFW